MYYAFDENKHIKSNNIYYVRSFEFYSVKIFNFLEWIT